MLRVLQTSLWLEGGCRSCLFCCLQEETLLKLQTSVDTEEKRWMQKLQKSSEELAQVSKLSQLLKCFLLVFSRGMCDAMTFMMQAKDELRKLTSGDAVGSQEVRTHARCASILMYSNCDVKTFRLVTT